MAESQTDNMEMRVRTYEIVFRDLIASLRKVDIPKYAQIIAQKQAQWLAQQERTGTYAGGSQ